MDAIDLTKIIKSKNPRLAKWLPRFAIRAFERLICLKRINYIIENYGDLPPLEFIEQTLRYIEVDYTLHGEELIDPQQRYIFASNHPLGGVDGMILSLLLSRFAPYGFKFVVNDILTNITPVAPIMVPVNKHGRQSGDYVRAHREMYFGRGQVFTFPAGLCSRLIDSRVQDTPWRNTFVQKARESDRQVVPVHVSALNSRSFYRWALWRKRLGIKANIEMILLPREMFAQRGKHIDVYLGEPLTIDDSMTTAQWVSTIRERSYSLPR
ncbi:MAG: acyltransferase [Rikenellaceae bacterium]